MVYIEFENKAGKKLKEFKSFQKAVDFLIVKGYVHDNINQYYWRVDPMFGWMMKAKIKETLN